MCRTKRDAYLLDSMKKYYTSDIKGHLDYCETDLDEALEITGVGRYQIIHCCLMVATLSSALLEIIGNAFILPAAACDLHLPDHLRGIITSIPNLGVILTAPLWGLASDSVGRKPVLLLSSAAAGAVGFAASFTTTLTGYAICKFVASLFLSCPSSLGWAYMSEVLPARRRDSVMLLCNGLLMMSAVLSPVIAWGILSHDWSYNGELLIKPWRFLTATYALPLLAVTLFLARADESPKFLMSRGKARRALQVVKRIYSVNSGLSPEEFRVTSLRPDDIDSEMTHSCGDLVTARRESGLTLLRPPHLKWLALIGFLMFGVFSVLNGLFLLAPDTINKVMNSASSEVGTICVLVDQLINQTSSVPCTYTMSHDTFLVTAVTTAACGALVVAASLSPLDKRTLLVGTFAAVGLTCLVSGLHQNRMVAGVALSALQMTALGIGPLTAYAVHLFPTSLRGTAVGAVLMCGRAGSVAGANAAGYLLSAACTATFYGFAALLFLCAALSLLLPKQHVSLTRPRGVDLHINRR